MKNTNFLAITLLSVALFGTREVVAQHNRRARTIVTKRPAHKVVTRTAQVHYSQMPRWGASVHVAPAGAVSLRYRNRPYYYHNGVYYEPRNGAYVVVRPFRGMRIGMLPVGYRPIVLGRRNYFYYYGTFYQPSGTGYVVVNPPVGAVVDSLPDGYEVANVDGREYYVLNGVTYAEVDAPEFPDGIGYEVISSN